MAIVTALLVGLVIGAIVGALLGVLALTVSRDAEPRDGIQGGEAMFVSGSIVSMLGVPAMGLGVVVWLLQVIV